MKIHPKPTPILLSALLSLGLTAITPGQVALWQLDVVGVDDPPDVEVTTAANINASASTDGAGYIDSAVGLTAFDTNAGSGVAIRHAAGGVTTVTDFEDRHTQFTITAAPGFLLNPTSLTFDSNRGGAAGTRGFEIYARANETPTIEDLLVKVEDEPGTRGEPTPRSVDLSAEEFQGITSITFRYFPLTTGDNQTIEFNAMTLNGDLVLLDEPVASSGGPYEVLLGGFLALDASASLPSVGEEITSIEWDLNNNNDFSDASGATPAPISSPDLLDAVGMSLGENTIQLRVTDSGMNTTTVSTTVTLVPLTAPIANAGFEEPTLDEGQLAAGAPGWTAFNDGEISVLHPGESDFSDPTPEGNNVGLVTSTLGVVDGLSQVLGETTGQLLEDASYTLEVEVGNFLFASGFPGYLIQLVAGGTVLAEDDNSQSLAQGAFTTSTVNYTYDAAEHAALLGEPLEIRLLSKGLEGGSEVAFDDVRLTVSLGSPLAKPGGPYLVFIGQSISLDASGSMPSDGAVLTDWEWDLNNNGDFSDASGETPTAISSDDLENLFGMVTGDNTIQLRVTDNSSPTPKTSTATTTVTLASDAQDGTWTANDNGDWSDSANWLDGIIANGIDQTATFGLTIGGNRTVSVDSDRTIGNIIRDWPFNGNLDIVGPETLTLAEDNPTITNNDLGNGRRMQISAPVASEDGLTIEGGYVLLTSANYSGDTVTNAELFSLGGIPVANIGGGEGRNISVAEGSIIHRGPTNLTNDFLARLVETTDEIGVFTNATGPSNNNNDIDFSGTNGGANLPNAFFATWAGNGAQHRFNGVFTPAADNYRIGFPGHSGALHIMQPLVDIDDTPRGLIIGGGTSNLTADNTFTGDTVLRAGRLFLGRNLALQNSALDVGTVDGPLTGQICFNNGPGNGAPSDQEVVDQPTLGGLIGSRSLTGVYSASSQNNISTLSIGNILGITLNVADGKTHTYGGNARLSTGMFLTKTGEGTQTLSGTNDYTGPTSVEEGTLALIGGSHASPITVADGASLGFTLGSPTTSSASVDLTQGTVKIEGTVDNSSDYLLMTASSFTGTPTLDMPITDYVLQLQNGDTELVLVYVGDGMGSPFATWSGGLPADGDANGDGVANAIAWVLGAANPNENALGLLPTLDNTSDVEYVRFTFTRLNAANDDADTTIEVEYSTDLVNWTTAEDDGDDVIIDVTPGTPSATVEVRLKRSALGADGRLFARLNVKVEVEE